MPPHKTVADACHRSAKCSMRAIFPIPASPATSRTRPCPASTSRSTALKSCASCSRSSNSIVTSERPTSSTAKSRASAGVRSHNPSTTAEASLYPTETAPAFALPSYWPRPLQSRPALQRGRSTAHPGRRQAALRGPRNLRQSIRPSDTPWSPARVLRRLPAE